MTADPVALAHEKYAQLAQVLDAAARIAGGAATFADAEARVAEVMDVLSRVATGGGPPLAFTVQDGDRDLFLRAAGEAASSSLETLRWALLEYHGIEA